MGLQRALFLAAAATSLHSIALAEDEYDQQCEAIEKHSRYAGQMANRGNMQEAYAALDRAREAFKTATSLNPVDPQAHISLATSMLNANQFDEAISLWKGAIERAENHEHLKAWLEGRERYTRYGRVSVKKDRTYAGGQGNITAALSLMSKQLGLYPKSPVFRHDMAVAHSMVSALRSESTDKALRGYRSSQVMAYSAWHAGLAERGRAGPSCSELNATAGEGLVYDWPAWHAKGAEARGSLVDVSLVGFDEGAGSGERYGDEDVFEDRGGYIARFENVGLSGDDAIIVDEARCLIFVASAGAFVPLHTNIQLLEVWGDPPTPYSSGPRYGWHDALRGRLPNHGQVASPQQVAKAASVGQFAAKSHFHTVTELCGRLALLQRSGVLEEEGMQLIAPRVKYPGFLKEALRIFAEDLVDGGRVINWEGPNEAPDVRLQVSDLRYADWLPPRVFGEDGGHCATPRSVVGLVRDAFIADGEEEVYPKPPCILYIKRPQSSDGAPNMRGTVRDDAKIRKALKSIASQADLVFEEFDGGLSPADTVALFGRARAVVGVHGGALTNMIFCPENAKVFEIGFTSPFAGHYRHLAASLGLEMHLLPIKADERGIAANDVALQDAAAATDAIRAALLGNAAAEGKSEL